jgi:hypothetical protein
MNRERRTAHAAERISSRNLLGSDEPSPIHRIDDRA